MSLDLQEELEQAHALIGRLPAGKAGAARPLPGVMVEDEEDELTADDRAAIQAGLDSLAGHGAVPMEDVLADFGLTIVEFEGMAAEPGSRPNGQACSGS
jgi:hypothetical protein